MNDNLQFWIPVSISVIAIVFTGYQQFVSNKQFLFDKRLLLYGIYKMLLNHQVEAGRYAQKNIDKFCDHYMLINELTNDSKLSSSVSGWNDRKEISSLMDSDNQKEFLSMIEELRRYGTESPFVFHSYGQELCNYFNKYADLCLKVYQYSILWKGIENQLKELHAKGTSMYSEDAIKKQRPLHKELNQLYKDLCDISQSISLSKLEKTILFIRMKRR